ncbi:MAG: alpha/beta fold hydrolase [Candidatus Heimdallarchaeota archaeon]
MKARSEWLATYHDGDPRLKNSRNGILQLNPEKLRVEFAVQTTEKESSPIILVNYPLEHLHRVQIIEKRQKLKKKVFLQLILGFPPNEMRPLFSFGLVEPKEIQIKIQEFIDNHKDKGDLESSQVEPDFLEAFAQLLTTPIGQIQQLLEPIRAVTNRILSFTTRPLITTLEPKYEYETQTIEVNKRRVTFFETAKVYPLALVMLSPVGGQIKDLFPLIGSFLGNYQVYILGMRGFTPPIEQDTEFTLKNYIRDLKDFLGYIRSVHERRIVLCAHSIFSAIILEEFIDPDSSDIEKLILISGAHKAPDNYRAGIRALPPPRLWPFKGQVKKIAPKVLFSTAANQTLTRSYIDQAFTIPDKIYYNLLKDLLPQFDYTKQIRQLEKPVLLIWGNNDSLIPSSLQEEMISLISSNNLVHRLVPGGHYVMLESPEAVGSEINKFMTQRYVISVD